jgi:DNA-binding transcriptional ArsR family regulator
MMWLVLGPADRATHHNLGEAWFDEFRTKLSDRTKDQANRLSPDGQLWEALLVLVEMSESGKAITDVLDWFSGVDPIWLRTNLLAENFWDTEPAIREAAARGVPEAVDQIAAAAVAQKMDPESCSGLATFLMVPVDELVPLVVDTITRVREEAFFQIEEEWAAALRRDAVATQMLIDQNPHPRDLIETVTKGISYEIPSGIRRMVLVPSVSLRPWTLTTTHEDTLLVCYSVADESLAFDPDAPPSWLLAVYRALGDERRLRLLRRLAEGPAGLADLTEYLGLAKSTVYHHIGVLRTAGLIRVQIGPGQTPVYSLRLEAIPDQGMLLNQYLLVADSATAQTGAQ